MALDGFSALLFVPAEPETLAEITRMILHCLLPLSTMRAFTQCHLKLD